MESAGDLKRKWAWSVEWLHDELDRGAGGAGVGHRAPYGNTAGSNETANGYFLERSHSARLTLEKACELLPDDETEAESEAGEQGAEVDRAGSGGESQAARRVSQVISPTQAGKQRIRRRSVFRKKKHRSLT